MINLYNILNIYTRLIYICYVIHVLICCCHAIITRSLISSQRNCFTGAPNLEKNIIFSFRGQVKISYLNIFVICSRINSSVCMQHVYIKAHLVYLFALSAGTHISSFTDVCRWNSSRKAQVYRYAFFRKTCIHFFLFSLAQILGYNNSFLTCTICYLRIANFISTHIYPYVHVYMYCALVTFILKCLANARKLIFFINYLNNFA